MNSCIGDTDTGVKAAGTDGADGAAGADGADGKDGTDGKDGITPQLKIGEDNFWYVSYDDGNSWESLNVQAVGEKGEKGDKGEQGIQGEKGDTGATGKDGQNGADGKDGIDGKDGQNGADGKDGVDGKDGQNGTDGKDGADGRGIDNAEVDSDGYLILYMSDGSSINAGLVRVNVDTAVASSTTVEKADGNTSEDGTTRALATAGVVTSGTSLLWNIVTLAVSFIRRKKTVI